LTISAHLYDSHLSTLEISLPNSHKTHGRNRGTTTQNLTSLCCSVGEKWTNIVTKKIATYYPTAVIITLYTTVVGVTVGHSFAESKLIDFGQRPDVNMNG